MFEEVPSSNSRTVSSALQGPLPRVPPSGTIVAIESRTGCFIGKVKGNGQSIGMADRNLEWEKFIVEDKGNGLYALRQEVSNLYLGLTEGENEQVRLTDACTDREQFSFEHVSPDWLAIRNMKGNYMKRYGGNVIWRSECLTGEHWKLLYRDAAPTQFTGKIQGAWAYSITKT